MIENMDVVVYEQGACMIFMIPLSTFRLFVAGSKLS